jgi:hypothetical protein
VLVLGVTSAAYGHPSETRNEVAFHGGPHCHVNLKSGHLTYPSHMGHLASGVGHVFDAADCP